MLIFFPKIVPVIGKTPSATLVHLIWIKTNIYIYIDYIVLVAVVLSVEMLVI